MCWPTLPRDSPRLSCRAPFFRAFRRQIRPGKAKNSSHMRNATGALSAPERQICVLLRSQADGCAELFPMEYP
eukprot:7387900-Pyramimonas_sp.AAC.1